MVCFRMSTANRRKKNPEQVKQSIIECATVLACSEGIVNISIQKVATMAGVTKGGLLHHFPSKRHLLEALYEAIIAQAEANIMTHIGNDREYGCFTRAYIRGMSGGLKDNPKTPQATLSMLLDSELCSVWKAWLTKKIETYKDTDSGEWLEMLRYSADGIWLSASVGILEDFADIQKRLIDATYKEVKI